ncbi:hypothetical protein [Saccharopolyspora taberi]|uniref:Uncharacterized protein n=1 Tax=Saccharopolyspora taberi TaxID=60895 RepID=A0ABN3VD62_9PSEU
MEAQQEQARPDAGPVTTRIVGELPLDEAMAPVGPASPGRVPPPDRVEVTQPYIPAIRGEQPEFAKRLSPEPPTPSGAAALVTDPIPAPVPRPAPVPASPPAQAAKPAVPVKKRSLVRRVVRKIIGPDLLRKDPPKKRR